MNTKKVESREWVRWLRYAAIAGNVIFVVWIVRNGINEGFRGTGPQIASFTGLVLLLTLNSLLLWRRGR